MLGICTDDPRVVEYANAAVERLLTQGMWVDTIQDYQICVFSSCITWPPNFGTIEAFSICGVSGLIRNGWWEFRGSGINRFQSNQCAGNTLVDRPSACAFDDVRGANQQLVLYADDPSDAGKQVLLQFYDQGGNPIRLSYSGTPGAWVYDPNGTTWVDGEWITLVAPPAYAHSAYSVMPGGLVGVQKPVTNNTVRLYSFDTVALTQYPLGYYQPYETSPWYRRSLIPGVTQMTPCSTSSVGCKQIQVIVRAKLKFVPVSGDNDWLGIGFLPALEEQCQAVMNYEPGGNEAKGLEKEQKAIRLLEQELRDHQGTGQIILPRFQSPLTWGAGRIGIHHCWR